jgi:L-ascorbate metabolism protein UlaG (beta-lactamase superfamily)
MDQLTFLGHAALGLNLGGYALLVDPFFNQNQQATIKPEQAKADYILVTHGHFDHLGDVETVARRTKAQVIAGGGICNFLRKKGIQTHTQQVGGCVQYPFGFVKFTIAIHSNSLPDGSEAGLACGFLITPASGKKIYIAGDTALFGDMRLIGEEGVDVAILPIGDVYTMGPGDAMRAVKFIQPRIVIPYHYNSLENLMQDADAWKKAVEAQTAARVLILKAGESIDL